MKEHVSKIVTIKKDDSEQICSARIIWAKIATKEGRIFNVAWADTPFTVGVSKNKLDINNQLFNLAWECKPGDKVKLMENTVTGFCHFIPSSED